MSDTTQRPALSVVTGAAQASGELRPRPTLASVPPPQPVRPHQLGLEGVPARPDTLISLGLQGIDFTDFASTLRRHGVRVVLDLRVSSSFRGSGFSMQLVLALFESQRVQYRRLPALVDRRDDRLVNEHVRQRRYAAFLAEQSARLAEVHALVLKGPAILIGWESHHPGSDRAILIDALQRLSTTTFELIVAPGQL
jgi:hypothetical protein